MSEGAENGREARAANLTKNETMKRTESARSRKAGGRSEWSELLLVFDAWVSPAMSVCWSLALGAGWIDYGDTG